MKMASPGPVFRDSRVSRLSFYRDAFLGLEQTCIRLGVALLGLSCVSGSFLTCPIAFTAAVNLPDTHRHRLCPGYVGRR
jgi:hypothetical protein